MEKVQKKILFEEYKNIVDKYYTFISDNYSLLSFDKNGNLSTLFFPDKDYYQNLDYFYSFILINKKLIHLNTNNFIIKFNFDENLEYLNIYYYPKPKILKYFNINEKFIFSKKDNYESYIQELFRKRYYILKRIIYSNEKEDTFTFSKFIIKIYPGNLNPDFYIEFYKWKLKDSKNYNSVRLRKDKNKKCISTYVYKQEFEFEIFSKNLISILPVYFGIKENLIKEIFKNFINYFNKNYKILKNNFSIIGVNQNKNFNHFYIENFESNINKLFYFYRIENNEECFEIKYNLRTLKNKFEKIKELDENYTKKINNLILENEKKFVPEDFLEKSSIYVLTKLQTRNGAILASYEQDEEYKNSGGYGYCWGRDGAIIADIMSKIGYKNYAKKFFGFIFNIIDEDGGLSQRYYSNGLKAPCWGEQYDEIGLVLWSFYNYINIYKDYEFLEIYKDKILKTIIYLSSLYEKNSNLFRPSIDLWEERYGYHLFSQICCIEGLKASFEILNILLNKYIIKKEEESILTEELKNNLFYDNNISFENNQKLDFFNLLVFFNNDFYKHFYKNILNTFITKNNNEISFKRSLILNEKSLYYDYTIDVSNLCLIYPFNVEMLDFNNKLKLLNIIDKNLKNKYNSFHFRYTNDKYMKGNSWILTTLWIIISKIDLYTCKENENEKFINKNELIEESKELIKKLNKIANDTGFLPEQIDKDMKPFWIQPLCWTHAFFLEFKSKLKTLGGIL